MGEQAAFDGIVARRMNRKDDRAQFLGPVERPLDRGRLAVFRSKILPILRVVRQSAMGVLDSPGERTQPLGGVLAVAVVALVILLRERLQFGFEPVCVVPVVELGGVLRVRRPRGRSKRLEELLLAGHILLVDNFALPAGLDLIELPQRARCVHYSRVGSTSAQQKFIDLR